MNSALKISDSETQQPARPFLKWVGGKRQLLPELMARIPTSYGRYYEPMVGGGALFFSLSPERATISDVNEEVINAYRVIANDVDGLIRDLKRHKHESDYYYQIRDKDRSGGYSKWDPVRRASRLIYLNKTCYNGLYRVNSRGEFNVPFGDYKNPTILDEINLRLCSEQIQRATIKVASFDGATRCARKGDFVYFDPPYAPLSATSYFTSYSKNGFCNEAQKTLRDTCIKLDKKGVFFMLSNSSAPIILDLYREFNISFVHASRFVNSVGSKRGKVKEVIVTNY